MTSLAHALDRAEKEAASYAAVGLGSIDAVQVTALAQELRQAGLEGPAREAEKLAALVGPQGPREEQLNAFARLHQMLALMRVKVATTEDLSGMDLEPVPSMESMRVDRALLGDPTVVSAPVYDASGGTSGRYAYLARANRWLSSRDDMAPEGEGLRIWCDLSVGGLLAHSFDGKPEQALAHAERALAMQNVAARRNAVRVIEGAFLAQAPLPAGHPALALLERARNDARPLVMFEAEAAANRLQGRPAHDTSAPYVALPKWPPVVPAPAVAATALGARAVAQMARVGYNRPTPGLRNYKEMPPAQWNPAEVAFYHLVRYHEWSQTWPDWEQVTNVELPRREMLSQFERQLSGKTELVNKSLDCLSFLEDPTAAPAVRPLVRADKDATRRRALVTLAVLGDPAALVAAEGFLEGNARDQRIAAWALGFLGDIRGWDILMKRMEERKLIEAVIDVLPLFGEVGATVLDRAASDPNLLPGVKMRQMLVRNYPGRELDALLYMVSRAQDPKGEAALLRPFAVTKKRAKQRQEMAEAAQKAGYRQNAAGLWEAVGDAKPVHEQASPGAKWSHPWFIWMQVENRRLIAPGSPLTPESEVEDWCDKLAQRLTLDVRNAQTLEEWRAKALRWLHVVGGDDGEARVTTALSTISTVEAERIRGLAFPTKKRKGAS
jgi:hypothetical protein